MKKQIKISISYFILGLFIICTYLLIISISGKDLSEPEYLEKELSNISVTDIINSHIFDSNNHIRKIRKNLDSIYSVADILDIPDDKITEIINSKISTDILTKIIININDTLVTGNKKELFNINDYNHIVDDNIDLITKEINLELSYEEKIILTKILKEVGEKTIKDIPDTNSVIERIDSYKLNIIKLVINNQVRHNLIIIDAILFLILLCLNLNCNILKILFKGLMILLVLLLITSIFVANISNMFNDEWLFIRRFILYFNYNIVLNIIYVVIITFIVFVSNSIIKRKA